MQPRAEDELVSFPNGRSTNLGESTDFPCFFFWVGSLSLDWLKGKNAEQPDQDPIVDGIFTHGFRLRASQDGPPQPCLLVYKDH